MTFLATYLSAQQVCSSSEKQTKIKWKKKKTVTLNSTGEVQYTLWLLHSSSEITH